MSVSPQRLSEHFTLAEMLESPTARRDLELWSKQCSPPAGVLANLTDLANEVLEPLRAVFDWPILVNSGYRCRELNERIGGSHWSQHCIGLAADVRLAPGFRRSQETLRARQQLRLDWFQRVGDSDSAILFAPSPTMPRNFYLWAAAALMLDDLAIHQLGHYGEPWEPAWIHIGARRAPRRELVATGVWTDGETRRYGSLPEFVQDMVEAS